MATSYSVRFVNDPSTQRTWTMAIYQTIPNMGPFTNVSWTQGSAPAGGSKTVNWTLDSNVVLADFFSSGDIGVFEPRQILAANLGTQWAVVNLKGIQQLQAEGTAPAGYIFIVNNSGLVANMGIGMSGAGSVYLGNALSGTKADFKVTPRYWAALFDSVVVGQVISNEISAAGPVEVVFAGGITSITLTAWVEGQTLHFGDKSL